MRAFRAGDTPEMVSPPPAAVGDHNGLVDEKTVRAVDWLLACPEPAVARIAERDLLDRPTARRRAGGPWVTALLDGIAADDHPYRKWTGSHWRLVSLVELEVPPDEPRCRAAYERVLDWLTGPRHRDTIQEIDGLVRRCASQEGNALAVGSRLEMAGDARVVLLARSLIEWQWPDGGWNCDRSASGRRSSFHETLPAIWGLHEFWKVTGDPAARGAAFRGAELLLDHEIYRSLTTGEPIKAAWLILHYPPYWHYDVLQALLVMARMGLAADPRGGGALDVLERRRLPDGRWRAGAYWWNRPGAGRGEDVVDWGRSGPNYMITLNALRVLKGAGRL